MVAVLRESPSAPQLRAAGVVRVPHLAALTGLRFFAALWVLAYHISISSSLSLPAVAGIGYAGVGFFFVLSGFILAYTYLDAHGRLRGSRRSFWQARAARIYPLYAVAYLVAAGPALWSHLSAATLGVAAPAALLLVQAWLPWAADVWNGPGWSLSAEAFYYALFPFVAVPVARLGRRGLVRLTAVCWALALAAPVTYIALNPDHLRSWGWGDGLWMRVLRFDPLIRLPEFLVGVALGCLFVQAYRGVEATGRSRSRLWSGLAVAALAAVVALPTLHVPLPYVLLHNGLLDPFFAVAIYSLAWRAGWLAWVMGSAPLVRLGQASYALYILHVPVLLWLTHLAPAPHGAGIAAACYWAGMAGLCVALALLAHRYVEEPARRRLRPSPSL